MYVYSNRIYLMFTYTNICNTWNYTMALIVIYAT